MIKLQEVDKMNWAKEFQDAIDCIEEHLTDNVDYNEIAKRACMSNFYFQRIFTVLCGYTLGDYIRYRRLTLAGIDLQKNKCKVIDVAFKYGYESPESFTRAFQKFHNITPSQAKSDGAKLNHFSRLSVNLILKGGNVMNYSIEEKSAFTVLEKVEKHSIVDEVNKNTIPEFWTRSHNDGTIKTIVDSLYESEDVLGICYGNIPTDAKTFDYGISGKCRKDIKVPDGFRLNTIPSRTWIIFECNGAMPNAIQETWHKICSEFFPTSEYKPTYEMDIEVYPKGDMNSENYKSYIWIPIKN